MTTAFLIVLALAAAGFFAYTRSRKPAGAARGTPGDPMLAGTWDVQYSINVPDKPLPHPEGFVIDIPTDGSVHYVTMPCDPLTEGASIRMRCRVEGTIVPRNFPDSPALISLYFQREGDTLAGGAFEAFRWYASFATQFLTPGEHEMSARFDENWTAIVTSSRSNNPQGYADALANAVRIGFVLGGGDGLGHGVCATGPARIVVTSFEVLR